MQETTNKGPALKSETTCFPFELESMGRAVRYQQWLFMNIKPFLGKRILEFGAGIGNLSQHLPKGEKLILVDIDGIFVNHLRAKFSTEPRVEIHLLSVQDKLHEKFAADDIDTIVSFNVLEHVQDDLSLVRDAIQLLRASKSTEKKRLITVVPAHPWAYGSIDREFGHLRRYSRGDFCKLLTDAGVIDFSDKKYCAHYMNLPGILGWFLNSRILKRKHIGENLVSVFERLCPIIRPLDNFFQKTLRIPIGLSLVVAVEV